MAQRVDDRYELIEVIASGGMATVWRALDTRLHRHVALKRPHPGGSDEHWRERLQREARLAAGISHPNLVTVFDAGSDDDGPYLIMELVEGPTLAEDIPWRSTATVLAMGSRLASALAAVHAAGIVHRDVKPSNIMVGDDGPLLTDFGIARRPDSSDRVTVEGAVVATPSYAAPEVLAGGEPTPAGDVFSLGVVLYEMLSGSPAFQGADRTPPPPLDDPAVDSLIAATLHPDPNLRPAAADLAKSLESGAPTVTLAAGRHERAGTGNTKRLTAMAAGDQPSRSTPRWLLPLVAGVALVVVGAIVLMALVDDPPSGTTSATSQPAQTQPPQSTGTSPPASTVSTTPDTTTPTTLATTTTLTTTTTTTTSPPTDPPAVALAELSEFEEVVVPIGPPDLKPKDRDRLIEMIEDLEEFVLSDQPDDDGDDVRETLDKVKDMIDKIREGTTREGVLAEFEDVREALEALMAADGETDD